MLDLSESSLSPHGLSQTIDVLAVSDGVLMAAYFLGNFHGSFDRYCVKAKVYVRIGGNTDCGILL
jgi:hypothetical protein